MGLINKIEDYKRDQADADKEKMNDEYLQVVKIGRGTKLVDPRTVK